MSQFETKRTASAFEHKLLAQFKRDVGRNERAPQRVLLAVSGGVDSMVLLTWLVKWQRRLGLSVAVGHVHHGAAEEAALQSYRDTTKAQVREFCRRHKIAFFSNHGELNELHTEAALRDRRLAFLRHWQTLKEFDHVVFAHHEDDLLETRILRLLRGTSGAGLVAMRPLSPGVWRPLLHVTRAEIVEYARSNQISYCEDPSNERVDAERNWLRHQWLKSLELRRGRGALRALARSLENIAQASQSHAELDSGRDCLSRAELALRPRQIQQALVAAYLSRLKVRGYAQTHVDEILKRLDTRQKSLTFDLLGLKFNVTPDFLWASRV